MSRFPEPESSVLELKAEVPGNNQIVKTVVGLCNMHGGKLVLGVTDDREVVGVSEEKVDELVQFLHQTIYEGCAPPILPHIYSQRIDDKLVLVVQVSPGGNKPYYVRSLGPQAGVFVRLGPSTLRADADTIAELQRQARGISYDQTPFHAASPDDLDAKKFSTFLKQRPAGFAGRVLEPHWRSYRLIVEEQSHRLPTIGGLLLFGQDPQRWFPEAFVLCSHFKGDAGRETLRSLDCTGDLFEQFEQAYEFTVSRLGRRYRIGAKKREEALDVPPVAVREILLNAIVHRSYAIPGPTKVAIYDSRVEIFSPGPFPGPIDVEHLTSGITYIRNTVIAKAFREAGYIEKLGSGFITVFDAYRRQGLATPQVVEGTNSVKCILPRVQEQAEGADDLLVSLFLRKGEVGVTDVMERLDLSRASAGRMLRAWVEQRRAVRMGRGPSTRYRLRST